jgi:hypothetical protein
MAVTLREIAAPRQPALGAVEDGDDCSLCVELEALLQQRRTLGAAAAPIGTVLDYLGQRLAVVPIPRGSKAPAVKDWPDLRITEENAHQWFNGEAQNIVTGKNIR